MMSAERKHFAAYTPPGSSYPPYISINSGGTDQSLVEITVRSPGNEDGTPGNTAVITLNRWHFSKLISDAKEQIK